MLRLWFWRLLAPHRPTCAGPSGRSDTAAARFQLCEGPSLLWRRASVFLAHIEFIS